ncbi:hypothetical protein NEOLEDRAFT_1171033, partial [Neolentinus lepideus HHB14362 ss-1]
MKLLAIVAGICVAFVVVFLCLVTFYSDNPVIRCCCGRRRRDLDDEVDDLEIGESAATAGTNPNKIAMGPVNSMHPSRPYDDADAATLVDADSRTTFVTKEALNHSVTSLPASG